MLVGSMLPPPSSEPLPPWLPCGPSSPLWPVCSSLPGGGRPRPRRLLRMLCVCRRAQVWVQACDSAIGSEITKSATQSASARRPGRFPSCNLCAPTRECLGHRLQQELAHGVAPRLPQRQQFPACRLVVLPLHLPAQPADVPSPGSGGRASDLRSKLQKQHTSPQPRVQQAFLAIDGAVRYDHASRALRQLEGAPIHPHVPPRHGAPAIPLPRPPLAA